MKRIISIAFAILFTAVTFAQNDNVTNFLGIPVDGSKANMIAKLKAKGFEYYNHDGLEYLTGEFNGMESKIHIVTNRDKVRRIAVVFDYKWDESEVKSQFNRLCRQFENKEGYVNPLVLSQCIADDVDVEYEMDANKKRFEASYIQVTKNEWDTTVIAVWATKYLLENYGVDDSANLDTLSHEESMALMLELGLKYLSTLSHKSVWFMIDEVLGSYGKYNIVLYYDNELNFANGEDL